MVSAKKNTVFPQVLKDAKLQIGDNYKDLNTCLFPSADIFHLVFRTAERPNTDYKLQIIVAYA